MDKRKANILVVDDEEVARQLLMDFLSDLGYHVQTAPDGETALSLARENPFDLIITDVRMPGMSGIELIHSIRELSLDVDTNFIVITGYSSVEAGIAAMREGAYDYIGKPFNLEEMRVVVERALERQNLMRKAKDTEYYRSLSILDGLTQLYNHRYFHELLTREINRALRYPQTFSLMMIDIDDFKKFNDTKGHLAGDCALREIGQIMLRTLRKVDLVCRYGGEEFSMIIPQTNKEATAVAAERLREIIANTEIKDESDAPLGKIAISIGIATFPDDGQGKEELIKAADAALYEAKNKGKNKVCCCTKSPVKQ